MWIYCSPWPLPKHILKMNVHPRASSLDPAFSIEKILDGYQSCQEQIHVCPLCVCGYKWQKIGALDKNPFLTGKCLWHRRQILWSILEISLVCKCICKFLLPRISLVASWGNFDVHSARLCIDICSKNGHRSGWRKKYIKNPSQKKWSFLSFKRKIAIIFPKYCTFQRGRKSLENGHFFCSRLVWKSLSWIFMSLLGWICKQMLQCHSHICNVDVLQRLLNGNWVCCRYCEKVPEKRCKNKSPPY